MSQENLNPFAIAQHQLDEAAKILKLDEATHQMLRWPVRELHVSLPVRMDDGSIQIFKGFRVQYNDSRGPTKGGIRFHPAETIDTVRALAAWMTWKTSVVDIPLGGSKGGVICNPKEMSRFELERLSRQYIKQVGRMIGPTKDVPAPDVYTTPQIMSWMMDEFYWQEGYNAFGVITGKPLAIGGSKGRGDATARGGVFCIREACKKLDIDPTKVSYAVQGFGNAGQNAAILMKELLGANKLVAVSDSRGGVYSTDGLDPVKLVEYKQKNGQVSGFPGAESISNQELLELDVDVLIPAAMENQITSDNAARIKARISAELANGPTTPEADKILYDRNVFVIPDFLCNAGGVTVSYFEQVQNAYNYYWTIDDVYKRLDQKMTDAFLNVYETAQKHSVDMRKAAYIVAVSRVVEAMKLRGWV